MAVITFEPRRSGAFEKYISNIAEKRLPRTWKRHIYVASLTAKLQQVNYLDQVLVEKVYKLLDIKEAKPKAKLPIKLKDLIWGNLLCRRVEVKGREVPMYRVTSLLSLTNDDYISIGEFLYSQAPDWIRYGSKALMVRDASLLLHQIVQHQRYINGLPANSVS